VGPEEALLEELWGLLEEEVGSGGGGVVERVATRFEAVQLGRVGGYSRGIGGVGGKCGALRGISVRCTGQGRGRDALVQEITGSLKFGAGGYRDLYFDEPWGGEEE